MKIWIAGGSGLVGLALQAACKRHKIPFVATGRAVDIGSPLNIKEFFELHSGITHIINCAAFTNVNEAQKNPEEAFRVNALGPANLGHLARLKNLKLLHLSTDYVFSSDGTALLSEDAACSPLSVYAKTKYEGERLLVEQFPHACIVRTSWVFGEGGKTFVSLLSEKLKKEEKVVVVDDQVNRLTYAQDLAEAVLALLCHEGIYHFANQGVVSRYEVAKTMQILLREKGCLLTCKEVSPISASTFLTDAPRPKFSALDTQKIERMMGKTPRPWQEALKEYIAHDSV